MTSPHPTERVSAFFKSYLRAFESFNAAAIADHFAFPCHVTADSGEIGLTAVAERGAWIAQLEKLLAMYRAINVASARIVDLRITTISAQLLLAVVHWDLDEPAGNWLYSFEAAYTLAGDGDALRITAIAHNEIPRYRECVARLRARGSAGNG